MARKRGMILDSLILYLVLGSLLMVSALQLFQVSWLSFQSARRLNDVTNDFVNVTERIKYDLLLDIESITIAEHDFNISFFKYETDQTTYAVRDYLVMMSGSRLIYNIFNGTSYTANYLSSLVKNITITVEGELMIIVFDYGDYQLRRSFRIDHIDKKRILYSFDDRPHDHLCCHRGEPSAGFGSEPLIQFDLSL